MPASALHAALPACRFRPAGTEKSFEFKFVSRFAVLYPVAMLLGTVYKRVPQPPIMGEHEKNL